jgi:hypothetical protein
MESGCGFVPCLCDTGFSGGCSGLADGWVGKEIWDWKSRREMGFGLDVIMVFWGGREWISDE